MVKNKQLENWEVSLIKKMLSNEAYTKQQILAYFSRPNRSINQARIVEISTYHERYEGIREATQNELSAYLEAWDKIEFPGPPNDMHLTQHLLIFPERNNKVSDSPQNVDLLNDIIGEFD